MVKVTIEVTGFTPDREFWRTETFSQPKIKKLTKKERSTGVSEENESFENKVIEIKTEEAVYEFPKGREAIQKYLEKKVSWKLLGCLGTIRQYFNSSIDPNEGGTRGLKSAFENAWHVTVIDVFDVGEVESNGFVRRFQYKGRSGGMGQHHFDQLGTFKAKVEITNPPIRTTAKNIFDQSIKYLEYTNLGRSGNIKVIDIEKE